jgi:SAM-dependent methyltransferase
MTTHLAMTPTPAFATIMELTNAFAYRYALDDLDLPSEGALLEIGFGSGRLLAMARKRWPRVTLAGVDPTPAMVAMAAGRRALHTNPRPDLRCCDASDLPWPSDSFDCAVCVGCAAEIRRVLKPAGRLILIMRHHGNHAPSWLPNPISRAGNEFDAARALLVEAGFDIPLGSRNKTDRKLVAVKPAPSPSPPARAS